MSRPRLTFEVNLFSQSQSSWEKVEVSSRTPELDSSSSLPSRGGMASEYQSLPSFPISKSENLLLFRHNSLIWEQTWLKFIMWISVCNPYWNVVNVQAYFEGDEEKAQHYLYFGWLDRGTWTMTRTAHLIPGYPPQRKGLIIIRLHISPWLTTYTVESRGKCEGSPKSIPVFFNHLHAICVWGIK